MRQLQPASTDAFIKTRIGNPLVRLRRMRDRKEEGVGLVFRFFPLISLFFFDVFSCACFVLENVRKLLSIICGCTD